MRKSRFTVEQAVPILRKADRDGVAAVAKRHAVSEQTLYAWPKRSGLGRCRPTTCGGSRAAHVRGSLAILEPLG